METAHPQKISSTIFLSRLTPCVNEITGNYQCGEQIKYKSIIQHPSVTAEKIKVPWDSKSPLYTVQERIRFSYIRILYTNTILPNLVK
jgi:hypothetical protein